MQCHWLVVDLLDIFYMSIIILEHYMKIFCTGSLPLELYQRPVYERCKTDVLRKHCHREL